MTMKLRNRLLALACFLLFLTLGGLIFLTSGPKKPFAIVLFITDNLNPACLTATRIYTGGGEARLQMEELPNTALCRNSSSDFSVPDSAAAATEIASGSKTQNGRLCLDASGSKLNSLLETAALKGRATGLITTGGLFSPSAAAFFAKSADPSNIKDLQEQFRTHAPFDMVVAFSDDRNFDTTMIPKESQIIRLPGDLESFPFWKRNPMVALLPSPSNQDGVTPDESLTLSDLVRIAIRRLQLNSNGYLLVVDDPEVGRAASANDGEKMFRQLSAFDKALATARRYAGENAMIIVTGRENIGGLQLSSQPFLHDKGVAVIALNNTGSPSLCWSTGPGYAVQTTQEGKSKKGPLGILTQPSAFTLPKANPTAGDVMTMGVGQGTDKIHGFLNLGDIHRFIDEGL